MSTLRKIVEKRRRDRRRNSDIRRQCQIDDVVKFVGSIICVHYA